MLRDLPRNYIRKLAARRGWRPASSVLLDDTLLSVPFGYEEEAEIKSAVRTIRNYTMISFERLATLWQQVRFLDRSRLQGALVECGTWRGGAVGIMVACSSQLQFHPDAPAPPVRQL
jgi:macrocin-O-methyltransferase TylF-like protien